MHLTQIFSDNLTEMAILQSNTYIRGRGSLYLLSEWFCQILALKIEYFYVQ